MGSRGGARRRILIVDDDDNVLRALERVLSHDFDIILASNEHDGLRIVAEKKCDAALVDLHLPGHGGFALRTSMRAYRANFPVVLITGATRNQEEEDELAKVPHILKPFRIADVARALDEASQ